MLYDLPKDQFRINISAYDYERRLMLQNRQLYLMSEIMEAEDSFEVSLSGQIIDDILDFNREDFGIPVEERKPIRLYINSPGGDIRDGFAIVSVIELSQTPVYTINVGQWSSMAFLIGIAGHKRFSLPNMTFLMHDGSVLAYDSSSKAQDKMSFEQRFKVDVIKRHILKHGKMTSAEYEALSRVEYYMLPEDALEHGFIDEIVTDINTIL